MLMRIVVALLLVATSKCQVQPGTDAPVISDTEPPVLTSVQIVAQGGGGTCEWGIGEYSECSATCEGTQTREVFCSCTISDGSVVDGSIVRATEDNCVRDSATLRPINERSCGLECPSPTPTTTAARATTATPTQPTTEAPSTAGPTTEEPTVQTPSGTPEGTTEPPSGTLFTADDVIRRGGETTCRWVTEPYSDCSATCEGIQTRDVFCSCTLSGSVVVRATGDNCDRDDLRFEPISQRGCNPECPPTTPPPTTPSPTTPSPTTPSPTTPSPTTPSATTEEPTTEEPTTEEPTTEEPTCTTPERRPRECNLTECQDSSDCYEDECCLQVYAKYDAANFYCFPLLEMGDVCDMEGNWTCPCGAGLQCQYDTNETLTRGKRSHKKHDEYYKYRQKVIFKSKTDTCPTLYHKEPKRPKYYNATCVPGLMTAASVIAEGVKCPTTTQPPPPPAALSISCDIIQCDNDSDCQDDECCLEVEYKEGKDKSVTRSFCMPQVNESGVCDPNGNWSCPCKDGFNCTQQNGKHKHKHHHKHHHKHKHGDAKKYRSKINLKEGDECPTIYKKKEKKDKYQHTCQEPSSGKRRRASNRDKERKEKPVVVFVGH